MTTTFGSTALNLLSSLGQSFSKGERIFLVARLLLKRAERVPVKAESNPRSTPPKAQQELEKQQGPGPKIESQSEVQRKMPQRSLLPALALVHDPWEEKFLTVTKDSLQKKVVQANGRCRPDEIPDEEREVMISWTKIGSHDGETYLQACRVTTLLWKKCVIRTV
ncbi:hypothetical protein F444_16005 [Phytophthora nicotianae P1976]|uniref:Uncharacterized protein n=1 Tax=Phytophthora nicotianae P1976 TaxID=1317066 RepID=A0A080ZJY1_PHYNI|nr:hypothetical protein F444_16005 [Phytophthora nicotianae P1976]